MLNVVQQSVDPATPNSGYVRIYAKDSDWWMKDSAGNVRSIGVPFLSGYIYGLELSNNATDATNDIDVAVGIAAASGAYSYLTLAASITKRLDAAWAVGTGNGGLDTGAIANTTYHVFLIRRSDTGVVDVLFSTSPTSPTMPTSYDQKRRIGSILRESAAIVGFIQNGDRFDRKTISGQSLNNPGTAAQTITVPVPTGIVVEANLIVAAQNTAAAGSTPMLFTSLDCTDTAPAAALSDIPPAANAAGYSINPATHKYLRTNTSAQIRARSSYSDASVYIVVNTIGWIDRRGGMMSQATQPAATNITNMTMQATTSGTNKDFTAIPSGVKRITINLAGVSTNGASELLIQIGDSGGIEATGYTGSSMGASVGGNGTSNYTTGYGVRLGLQAATVRYGSIVLSLIDAATNTWVAAGVAASTDGTGSYTGGSKSLSAELDRVRITTLNGTDAFDAGNVNVSYEF